MKHIVRVLLASVICFASYFSGTSQQKTNNTVVSEQSSGKELSIRYCAMCHKYTEPGLLDKATWANSVLPNMALRLGLQMAGKDNYIVSDSIEADILKKLNTFPDTPLISEKDWAAIVEYFVENAPEKLETYAKRPKKSKIDFPFETQSVTIDGSKLPQVTLLEYDEYNSELYIGDHLKLYALKNTGVLSGEWKLGSYASDIEFDPKSDPTLLTIGKLVPSNQKLGELGSLSKNSDFFKGSPSFSTLRRPVNFLSADLNLDGNDDLIICNFGHTVGKLSWFDGKDATKEHILSTLPGTRKVEVNDFDKDGLPDIIAMSTQAYEGITIYYNQGKNVFKPIRVLEFTPVHGLSYFELADFNSDGHQDILVTNGDNRDFSPIDKPYHGVRVYMNNTKNQFEETFFYPMYDCNKAMARDFDNDGDLDIIASALFVDYKGESNIKDAVVYLNNTGKHDFYPILMPNPIHGNWLTMEAGDFNKDGLVDVMLGTFMYDINEMIRIGSATGIINFPQVLLLTNKN
ncbi:FG-GAP repeat domain-containing protein [Costertonia aggregata]|uniref:VCBS repeat-containing protein n=1 Tax=Costertonia aggregata TaxID=343403 RepID=A0A7H9AMU4_9FLAO|nr:VCBS repeat-containing protein [Costertonia aggregata]QLG44760.1 VCBS repeat-containing protein [Costertonia aggregata]